MRHSSLIGAARVGREISKNIAVELSNMFASGEDKIIGDVSPHAFFSRSIHRVGNRVSKTQRARRPADRRAPSSRNRAPVPEFISILLFETSRLAHGPAWWLLPLSFPPTSHAILLFMCGTSAPRGGGWSEVAGLRRHGGVCSPHSAVDAPQGEVIWTHGNTCYPPVASASRSLTSILDQQPEKHVTFLILLAART
jgi:hypothetical protein